MKKKKLWNKTTKIILSCVLGVAIILGVGIAIDYGSGTSLSGTLIQGVEEGTGEFDWKRYEVDIALNSGVDETKYYTNCEGDYIYDIKFESKKNIQAFQTISTKDYYEITYYQYFNIADDLQTIVVLSDGQHKYVPSMQTSHFPVGSDAIAISVSEIEMNNLSDAYHIIEIYVRTVD